MTELVLTSIDSDDRFDFCVMADGTHVLIRCYPDGWNYPTNGAVLSADDVAALAVWLAPHIPADRIADVTATYIDRRNQTLDLAPVETWGL